MGVSGGEHMYIIIRFISCLQVHCTTSRPSVLLADMYTPDVRSAEQPQDPIDHSNTAFVEYIARTECTMVSYFLLGRSVPG